MNAYLSKTIAAGLLAAASMSASAVTLNPKGLGQVLIYPYYTVNKNQDTLLSLANASDLGKAVKLRVHEGYNGRDVLAFNVFLAPHDVWVAGVSSIGGATSGAQLSSSDRSCSAGLANPEPLRASQYDGSTPAAPVDGGPTAITRTREGWIEVIAMGDIVAGSALETAVTHPQPDTPGAGVPTCAAPLGDNAAVAADLAPPTSGLFGAADIVDVGEGIFYAYDATALAGFFDLPTNLYTPPGGAAPTLAVATNQASVAGGAFAHVVTDSGDVLTLDYALGIDAVTAVLQSDTLYNEYLVSPALGASSDWVVTFPTKHFYVDQQLYPSDNSISPFEQPFANGRSDVSVKYDVYDREQGTKIPLCIGEDPNCLQSPVLLGYETNVINLQPTHESALGSNLTAKIAPFAEDGWIRLDLGGKPDEFLGFYQHYMNVGVGQPAGSYYVNGLPALGFMVYNIVNTQAQPGRLANYSGLFPHRARVSCGGAPAPSVNICP